MTLPSSDSDLSPIEQEALDKLYDDEVAELWKEHADGVRKQVLRWGASDVVEAEDVTSEAFFVLRRRWPEWRSAREPAGYLYKTAKNILKWWQKNFKRELSGQYLRDLAERPFGLPEEVIFLEDLKKALESLSARQRQAVVLRHFHDFDLADTAELMELTEGAVKRYAHDGLKRLRGLMEGYEYGSGADR